MFVILSKICTKHAIINNTLWRSIFTIHLTTTKEICPYDLNLVKSTLNIIFKCPILLILQCEYNNKPLNNIEYKKTIVMKINAAQNNSLCRDYFKVHSTFSEGLRGADLFSSSTIIRIPAFLLLWLYFFSSCSLHSLWRWVSLFW